MKADACWEVIPVWITAAKPRELARTRFSDALGDEWRTRFEYPCLSSQSVFGREPARHKFQQYYGILLSHSIYGHQGRPSDVDAVAHAPQAIRRAVRDGTGLRPAWVSARVSRTRVVHDHASAPADLEHGEVLLNLTPCLLRFVGILLSWTEDIALSSLVQSRPFEVFWIAKVAKVNRTGEGNGPQVFWGEISPCDHTVQIYEEDGALLDALEGFIGGGLKAGDGTVVIATPVHLAGLESRLRTRGVDLDSVRASNQYVSLEAEQTLFQFIRDGWPDEQLFGACIRRILDRAKAHERRVRAFGEMVALLWAQGHSDATIRLEHLWHTVCRTNAFSLLCAYPRSGFTQDASDSFREICAAHDKVVDRFN